VTDKRTVAEKKRDLYKLIIAQDSLNAALEGILYLIELNAKPSEIVYSGMQESVIISYGRAFTDMDPFGGLSGRWQKFDDANYQKCHNFLIESRNKRVGHTEYIKDKIVLYPPNTLLYGGLGNDSINHVVKSQYMDAKVTKLVKETIQDLLSRMHDSIKDALTELYLSRTDFRQPEELLSLEDVRKLRPGYDITGA